MRQQQMARLRAAPALVAALLVASGLGLGACGSGPGQQVRSAAPGATVAPTSPQPYDEVQARYDALTARAATVDARGPRTLVERVALPRPVATRSRAGQAISVSTARRLTIIGGPFPYGDARIIVRLDGVALGEGRSGDGGRALSIAVLDPAALRPGAIVSYQVGARPPVVVGPLPAGS